MDWFVRVKFKRLSGSPDMRPTDCARLLSFLKIKIKTVGSRPTASNFFYVKKSNQKSTQTHGRLIAEVSRVPDLRYHGHRDLGSEY